MRIAITGGAGGLGTALSSLAVECGHTVVAIDRPVAGPGSESTGVEQVRLDITRYDDLARAVDGCGALVHLAAYTHPRGRPDHEVHGNNVVGSYNALSAAVHAGIRRVCLASSVNAIGGFFSESPRYDYFPVDEHHPGYAEDAYSLSKWIAEAQGAAMARRFEDLTVASLRLHFLVRDRAHAQSVYGDPPAEIGTRNLWGYTSMEAAARACLLALTADFSGHETFYVVAPHTTTERPTSELCRDLFPDVPLMRELPGRTSLYDSGKARRILSWEHDS